MKKNAPKVSSPEDEKVIDRVSINNNLSLLNNELTVFRAKVDRFLKDDIDWKDLNTNLRRAQQWIHSELGLEKPTK